MKIKFTGLNLSDLAKEYYELLGVDKDREQARKNLLGMKEHLVDWKALGAAMTSIHKKQKSELKKLIEEAKKKA